MVVGVWRSLVARSVRDAEVAGSNPVTPTTEKTHFTWVFSVAQHGRAKNYFFLI